MAMSHLNSGMRNQAVCMLQAGVHVSQRKVARRFNVHPCTLSLLLRRYHQTGSIDDRLRPGRHFVTTPRTFNKRNHGNVTCGIDLQLVQLH